MDGEGNLGKSLPLCIEEHTLLVELDLVCFSHLSTRSYDRCCNDRDDVSFDGMLFQVFQSDSHMRALLYLLFTSEGSKSTVLHEGVCAHRPKVQEENHPNQCHSQDQADCCKEMFGIEGHLTEEVVVEETDQWGRKHIQPEEEGPLL